MTGRERKNRFYLIIFVLWAVFWGYTQWRLDHNIGLLQTYVGGRDQEKAALAVEAALIDQQTYQRNINIAVGVPIGVFFLISIGDLIERDANRRR